MLPGQDDYQLTLSAGERSRVSVLVIESDAMDRSNMRTALRSLGFGFIAEAPTHAAALEKLTERRFSHIIFEAKKTNMSVKDFLSQVLKDDIETIAIPSSYEPSVDDVFDLLIMGARGYLVKPFTVQSVDQSVVNATKGEPISELVLQAKDRNEALVAIMMSSLDRAATIMRQAQQFETAKREIPKALGSFYRGVELAKTFAKDGENGLLVALESFCIERGKGPATRLGRLRKRLKTGRVEDPIPQGE